MVYEFRLPDIGEGVAEGEVVKWFVREGDTVREDAPLVSVLTDKANVEIPSPKSGRVVKLHAAEGAKLKVGGLLVSIETEGGSAPTPPAAEGPAPSNAPTSPTPEAPSSSSPPASAPAAAPGPESLGTARVLATPMVRRLAAQKGVDLAAVRGSGPGGRVTEQDIERAATGAPAVVPTTPAAASPAAPAAPEAGAAAVAASPSKAPMTEAPAGPAAPAEPGAVVPVPAMPDIERVPIRGLRRVIAEHMAEAVHRAAHFTYVEEVDASELVRFRERMSRHVEKGGVKLTYLPFIIKGVIAGLRAFPSMNATMDDERQELVVHRRYHLGIAMAAPDGLIVPVIRDANTKSVAELARELGEYAERGRTGKLTRAELVGSTFTITSLGALGGVLATPILNYPEVAILGVHKIVRRPVYRTDGSVGPADLMNLSVSLDHRVLDGITGAQFLAVVKSYLEDPHQLFAEMA